MQVYNIDESVASVALSEIKLIIDTMKCSDAQKLVALEMISDVVEEFIGGSDETTESFKS